MSDGYILLAILLSALCTFLLRFFPFILFGGKRKPPEWLEKLGKTLPGAVIAILIVYCLKDITDDFTGVGLPRLIAVAVVAASYKWKHNTLLSIVSGTACYMILLRVFRLL